jgi:hypothetical protein
MAPTPFFSNRENSGVAMPSTPEQSISGLRKRMPATFMVSFLYLSYLKRLERHVLERAPYCRLCDVFGMLDVLGVKDLHGKVYAYECHLSDHEGAVEES